MRGRWWWLLLIERGGSGVNFGAGEGRSHVWVLMVGGWACLVVIGGLLVVGSDGAHSLVCVDGGVAVVDQAWW